MMEKATFAAGCFWGVEELFRKIKGVISTKVGYTGGRTKNPTYMKVCTNLTGHAESIEITFDPKVISYKKLLKIFWKNHNYKTLNRQGFDIGSQYRSAIFYHNKEQKEKAIKSKPEDAVTKIIKAKEFYQAEEHHQKYLQKKGLKTC